MRSADLKAKRAKLLDEAKKIEAADQAFRKVLEINPDNAGALNYLGYMLVDHGMKVEEATGMIKKALDSDTDNGAYLDSLGWAYFRQGKLAPFRIQQPVRPECRQERQDFGDLRSASLECAQPRL